MDAGKKYFLFFFFMILLSLSCEYKIHENFVDLELKEEIDVLIDLNLLSDGRTFYLNYQKDVGYSIYAEDKEIDYISFEVGGVSWETVQTQGFIPSYIFPSEAGEYQLKCDIQTRTGSGSIAGQIGAEVYRASFSIPFRINPEMEIPVLTTRINEDGFLELSWNEPVFSHLQPLGYTLSKIIPSWGIESLDIPMGVNRYVDKSYTGGEVIYSLALRLPGDTEEVSWHLGSIDINNEIRLYTGEGDRNFITVHWEIPMRSVAFIQIDDEEPIRIAEGQTSMQVPAGLFGATFYGESKIVTLLIYPGNDLSAVPLKESISVGSPGKLIHDYYHNTWYYNRVTGLLYTENSESLFLYSYPDFIRERVIAGTPLSCEYVFSSVNLPYMVAVDRWGWEQTNKVNVWNARNFSLVYSFDSPVREVSGAQLTNDDKVYIFSYAWNDSWLYVFDLAGQLQKKMLLPDQEFIFSPDGKYAVSKYISDRLTIVEIKGEEAVSYDYSTGSYIYYDGIYFHPVRTDQIILKHEDRIEIRRCPDFELVRTFPFEREFRIKTIDPVTGYLLVGVEETYYGGEINLLVIDPDSGNTLFEIGAVGTSRMYLYNNMLISDNNYLLDLNKYLKR